MVICPWLCEFTGGYLIWWKCLQNRVSTELKPGLESRCSKWWFFSSTNGDSTDKAADATVNKPCRIGIISKIELKWTWDKSYQHFRRSCHNMSCHFIMSIMINILTGWKLFRNGNKQSANQPRSAMCPWHPCPVSPVFWLFLVVTSSYLVSFAA